ncbi:MAG: type II secretion system F family protein [Henriciella sp.]|jgi:tight adherence protein C|nr:type II secretion system F family protein [Henriciella sp.]MBO6694367.1 type II secretion system F family protein [Henriciella sp.]
MLETILNSPSLMALSVSALSLALFLPATIIASRFRNRIEGRLAGNSGGATTISEKPRHGWLAQLGQTGDGAPSDEETRLRSMMMRAGYFSKNAPYIFFGIRAISLIAPQFILFISAPMLPFQLTGLTLLSASVIAAAVGYMLPSMFLNRQIEQREQQYRDGFPDMMDLLVACVEAGLSLDGAILRIAEELQFRYPILSRQLHMMSLEMRAGRDRNTAWSNFAERLGLDEARSLATMLKQSEELGTSIGETLRVYGSDMREKRMLRAEEKALALPAKLVLPLIMFVFPTLLVVLMMPAVVRMIWVFSGEAL